MNEVGSTLLKDTLLSRVWLRQNTGDRAKMGIPDQKCITPGQGDILDAKWFEVIPRLSNVSIV